MTASSPQSGQRAVVTGGAGFLGSHLCERLAGHGIRVTCVDNFITGSAANVSHLTASTLFTLINRDITDDLDISGPVEYVFHLASPASPADYLRFPVQTLKAGSLGTIHALELARKKRARFILASSSEVYGDPLQHPQPESYWGKVNPIGPRSPYDEAKCFAEATTAASARTYGTSAAIARIFNSYGPRMRPGDGRAVPTFIRQALAGDPVTVTGDGKQTRSLCYVDDTINGILALAASPYLGPVNIGGDTEMTVLQIATLIPGITGSASPVRFIPRPPDDPSPRRPDISLARDLLRWEAVIQPADGLKRTITWVTARRSQCGQLPLQRRGAARSCLPPLRSCGRMAGSDGEREAPDARWRRGRPPRAVSSSSCGGDIRRPGPPRGRPDCRAGRWGRG